MVKQEVKKEVNKIFISEGVKAISQKTDSVPDVLPKPVSKKSKPKEVSYTKNPVLNKILNETAQGNEMEEYPTMSGKSFDSSRYARCPCTIPLGKLGVTPSRLKSIWYFDSSFL